jgi:hypothetical protein
MTYPHKISVSEIPVPPRMIQTVIETDHGTYTTKKQLFATPEEFLTFWKPLVDYYERVENASKTQ